MDGESNVLSGHLNFFLSMNVGCLRWLSVHDNRRLREGYMKASHILFSLRKRGYAKRKTKQSCRRRLRLGVAVDGKLEVLFINPFRWLWFSIVAL